MLTDDEIKAGGRWTSPEAEALYRTYESILANIIDGHKRAFAERYKFIEPTALEALCAQRALFDDPNYTWRIEQLADTRGMYFSPIIVVKNSDSLLLPERAT